MSRRSPAKGNQAADTPPADQDEQAPGAEPLEARDEEDGDEDREAIVEALVEELVPEKVATALKITRPEQVALLAELCYTFGLNPNPALKPREVIAHKFDAGDENATPPVPPSVTVVTGGGLKIRYPFDDDTENRLRIVFNAYTVRNGERVTLPLPADLTLPRASVDGQVHSTEHQYRKGYLREGGREEANRRAKLKALRQA
jgi:hypothetical protein